VVTPVVPSEEQVRNGIIQRSSTKDNGSLSNCVVLQKLMMGLPLRRHCNKSYRHRSCAICHSNIHLCPLEYAIKLVATHVILYVCAGGPVNVRSCFHRPIEEERLFKCPGADKYFYTLAHTRTLRSHRGDGIASMRGNSIVIKASPAT
jgi:hypothetical protein